MKAITLFCGASSGNNSIYRDIAYKTGQFLAKNEIALVYGGAKIGLMGAVADGALSLNGKVIGIIPEFLTAKEIRHDLLTEKHTVTSMHERKLMMSELCDGVIALPGGFGTLDELFEMLTWAQLGLHQKPIGILNVNGYYNLLLKLLEDMETEGFISKVNKNILITSNNIEDLIANMEVYIPPTIPTWIKRNQV